MTTVSRCLLLANFQAMVETINLGRTRRLVSSLHTVDLYFPPHAQHICCAVNKYLWQKIMSELYHSRAMHGAFLGMAVACAAVGFMSQLPTFSRILRTPLLETLLA